MQLAVLVALRSPSCSGSSGQGSPTGDASTAWLGDTLARLGFRVLTIADESGLDALVDGSLGRVTRSEAALIHVSGRITKEGELFVAGGRSIALSQITGSCETGTLAVFELVHEGAEDDSLLAAEYVDRVRGAVPSPLLVAVRAEAREADPLAFTRLLLARVEADRGALLGEVVQALRADAETLTAAQSFALARGAAEMLVASAAEAPEVAPLLALAEGAMGKSDWAQAIAGFRAALLVMPQEKAVRAPVYARIGAAQSSLGEPFAARRSLERAHAGLPKDRAILDSLITAFSEGGDSARLVALTRARLDLLDTAQEKVEELFSLAQLLVTELRDLPGAVVELEKARALDPSRDDVLEALRRGYRKLEQWQKLIEITGALADQAPTATERAARRVSQAKISVQHTADQTQAIRFLQEALADDPTHDEALDMLVELREHRGELDALEGALVSAVSNLEELGDAERAREAASRLDSIRTTRASVPPPSEEEPAPNTVESLPPPSDTQATPALDEAVPPSTERTDANPALSANDSDTVTPRLLHGSSAQELEAAALEAPLQPAIYATLFAIHAGESRTDNAFLAALALEELGALTPESQAIVEQCRPDGLRVRTSLDDEAWRQLRAPGTDPVAEALFAAIGPAAIAAHLDERKQKRSLVQLDPARRQPPTSTASIVRGFHWAARVVGIPCPALYVVDEVPGDVAAVPAAEPSTILGPGVLRGLTTKDLAYLAGRHLTYYRPEHQVLLYFPTMQGLTKLVLAAVELVLPAVPIPAPVAPQVRALRARLERHLGEEERALVTSAIRKLDARGGRIDLLRWIRSVELTAGRVGLVLCGDMKNAMSRIRAESREVAGLTADVKRKDLLAFCVSGAHAEIRARLAVATTTSWPPPPVSRTSASIPPAADSAVGQT